LSEPIGSKDEDYPPIPEVIKTVSYLATFIIAFFGGRLFLPIELQYVLATVFVVSTVLFILWIWRRPFRHFWKTVKRNEIVGTNYSQLVRFCERFKAFTDYNMTNNPQYVIGNIRNSPGFESVAVVEPHYANTLAYELQNGVRTLKPGLDTFVWVADLLTDMIRFYSDVFVAKPIAQIRSILEGGAGKIAPAYRADYNVARERFVGFVAEYEEFISKINKELGQVRRKVGETWRDEELLRSFYIERPKAL